MDSQKRWKQTYVYEREDDQYVLFKNVLTYLSQVILHVEEVCVLGLVNHSFDEVFGLMDDGEVEQPRETEQET